MLQQFRYSFIVTIVCVLIAAWWGWRSGGPVMAAEAILITLVLGVLEVSLSFDNAVVNAAVLQEMDAKWQRIFLTVGILIAVFGMRLVFPIVIVSVVTGLGWIDVSQMALTQPDEYARHLTASHIQIALFGGTFLLLVFLYFIFDAEREVHWVDGFERWAAKLGRQDGVAIFIALVMILLLQRFLPQAERLSAVISGIAGIILYVMVSSVDLLFEQDNEHHQAAAGQATRSGIAGFLYLEVLDASFSFDGVIGAFAITKDVIIIMVGLTIGAMFVRSLTVVMVQHGTLKQYRFLEHGAHYAIGVLALIMFASTTMHIPEVVTGLLGVAFIGAALRSSVVYNRAITSQH
ncbi:MAG: DUF475 domain-containing protein [Magnetococcales bacterium]|nr:DUF475 domain-containing protein [Magnetococcales bacterium]